MDGSRQPDGKFGKGNKVARGRPKGKPNALSQDLKSGIIEAAILHGEDGNGKDGLRGCCSWLLKEHTRQFVPLLVRLLPLQVDGQVVHHSKVHINILPVERGCFYDAEGKLHRGTTPPVLEHMPRAEEPRAMNASPLHPAPDGDDAA